MAFEDEVPQPWGMPPGVGFGAAPPAPPTARRALRPNPLDLLLGLRPGTPGYSGVTPPSMTLAQAIERKAAADKAAGLSADPATSGHGPVESSGFVEETTIGGPGRQITRSGSPSSEPFQITDAVREGAFNPESVPRWGGVDGLMTQGQLAQDEIARAGIERRNQTALSGIEAAESAREDAALGPLELAAKRAKLASLAADPFAEITAKGRAEKGVAEAPFMAQRAADLEDERKLKEIEDETIARVSADPEYKALQQANPALAVPYLRRAVEKAKENFKLARGKFNYAPDRQLNLG